MDPRASWEAWERTTALRMLQAVEAASTVVHDAVHALTECCLQLHPAAAESLYNLSYEAAKKVRLTCSRHNVLHDRGIACESQALRRGATFSLAADIDDIC